MGAIGIFGEEQRLQCQTSREKDWSWTDDKWSSLLRIFRQEGFLSGYKSSLLILLLRNGVNIRFDHNGEC